MGTSEDRPNLDLSRTRSMAKPTDIHDIKVLNSIPMSVLSENCSTVVVA